MRFPSRVARGARTAAIRLSTTTAATLRAGGRTFPVGTAARTVSIPLPSSPASGVLRIPLTVTSQGGGQRPLRQTIAVFRR